MSGTTVRLPQLRPLQRELLDAMARWNVWVCHRRFGKTLLCLCLLIKESHSCPHPSPRYAYLAPLFRQAKQISWDYLRRFAAQIPGAVPNEAELRLDLPWNNARIQLLGADNPDSLRGMYLDGCILDEYAQMQPRAWTQVIRPALSDRLGWAIKVGTPYGKNHFYFDWREAVRAQEGGDTDYHAALYRASETGVIPQAELDSARQTMRASFGDLAGDADYEQEYECFPPGTMIATPYGHARIEGVGVGDVVLSHTGRARKVQGVMSQVHTGSLRVIATYGSSKALRCTPHHPLYTFNGETKRHEWKPAQDVRRGDWLVMPRMAVQRSEVLPHLSLPVAQLMGWYIAEGSFIKNAVQLSLGTEAEAAQVGALCDQIGASWVSWKAPTAHMIQLKDARLADFLLAHCGSGAGEKRLPHALIQGHEHAVLDALVAGDGSEGVHKGVARRTYSTVSYALALDVQLLAHSLGYRAGISVRPGGRAIIEGREVQVRESYHLEMSLHCPPGTGKRAETRHSMLVRVRHVSEQPYAGMVHNLMVAEDNSYVAEGRAVHNCQWEAAIPGAYYAEELRLVDVQRRITAVPYDPTYPVYTAWDLGINDATAIWSFQCIGRQIALLSYYEASGYGAPHYAEYLASQPYQGHYRGHLLPHDGGHHEWGTGERREVTLQRLVQGEVYVQQRPGLDTSINSVRVLFPRLVFDQDGCERGIEALRNYHHRWDTTRKVFLSMPEHNWACHGADALRTLAVSLDQIDQIEKSFTRTLPPEQGPFDWLTGNAVRGYSGQGKLAWMG